MQMMTAEVLLMVVEAKLAGREILTADIAKALDVPTGTASRNLRYWADGHSEKKKAGLGLLKINEDPSDGRKNRIFLTRKGELFVERLSECIRYI